MFEIDWRLFGGIQDEAHMKRENMDSSVDAKNKSATKMNSTNEVAILTSSSAMNNILSYST